MHNAIILCGGLSTRLGDITKDIPKILLDIGGISVLDLQLRKLKAAGVHEVILAAGHLAEVLQEKIGGEREGVRLIYVIEEKRLGTGGAIKHALSYISSPDQPTWVLNGDILYTIDFSDMAAKLNLSSDGVIYGAQVDDASTYGTLEYDLENHLQAFKEKQGMHEPGVINAGLYLFTPRVSDYFPTQDAFSIEYDVFPHMKDLYVYVSDVPWVDIGVPERLRWAREHHHLFV